eukprot:TRINITY_DN54810_c0_g1_i1.p1 TRINITY_DN54810_c0_g1~~TRINITY_DN54810_c0_g1_i1.p1  ORF type:complete len:558 (+),score=72.68 TRINITY_DN54810_c0_g1_i1:54-1676(+)
MPAVPPIAWVANDAKDDRVEVPRDVFESDCAPACWNKVRPLRVLVGLCRLVGHVFITPQGVTTGRGNPSTLDRNERQTLASDLSLFWHFNRDFGRTVHGGRLGWQRLFVPLQRCPMVFIALELFMGLDIWSFGRPVDPDWLDRMPVDNHTGMLAAERLPIQKRAHFARALQLAGSWRSWRELGVETSAGDWGVRARLMEFCLVVAGPWQVVNSLASVALRGAGCTVAQMGSMPLFTDFLGCPMSPHTWSPRLGELCTSPRLEPPVSSFAVFWRDFSRALVLRPTIQFPWGFQDADKGSAPHLMASVFPAAVRAIVASEGTGEALVLEFGVFNGSSLDFIARGLRKMAALIGAPVPMVYGFDSFQGLPVTWRRFGRTKFPVGSFSLDKLPEVETNARLVRGWFNESLPSFLDELHRTAVVEFRATPWISFVHFDCDIYESTKEVLWEINPLLRPGTILVFDELVNFQEFRDGEIAALFEFLRDHAWSFRVLYGPWQVALDAAEWQELELVGLRESDLHQAVAVELLASRQYQDHRERRDGN